jgi:hypothetical protein
LIFIYFSLIKTEKEKIKHKMFGQIQFYSNEKEEEDRQKGKKVIRRGTKPGTTRSEATKSKTSRAVRAYHATGLTASERAEKEAEKAEEAKRQAKEETERQAEIRRSLERQQNPEESKKIAAEAVDNYMKQRGYK